jgi:hypothetical protein
MNRTYRKIFNFKKLGGTEKAQKVAIRWRDAQLRALGRPLGKPRTSVRGITKNSTGLVGIRKIFQKYYYQRKSRGRKFKQGGWYFAVTGGVRRDGKIRQTHISINKYGEKKALDLAKRKRNEYLKDMLGK